MDPTEFQRQVLARLDSLAAAVAGLKRSARREVAPADPAAELLGNGCLKLAAAARFSGLGRTDLYQHMRAGRLPWVKVGKNRLIPRKTLVALLAANLTGPPTA